MAKEKKILEIRNGDVPKEFPDWETIEKIHLFGGPLDLRAQNFLNVALKNHVGYRAMDQEALEAMDHSE
jgi:hypothetical protein